MNFKYSVVAVSCIAIGIALFFTNETNHSSAPVGAAINTSLLFAQVDAAGEKIQQHNLTPINKKTELIETKPITATETKKNHPFDNAADFYTSLRWGIRDWHQEKGYALVESLNNYNGPDNYAGSHPYGYLNEEQIKQLANNSDPDAQYIYATYYLRDQAEESIHLLKEILINTEKTAPLIELGKQLLNKMRKEDPANQELENEAYAYFMLMKQRQDPMGDTMLNAMGFNRYDKNRQEEIQSLSQKILQDLNSQRNERGFDSYNDQPLDMAKALGVSQEEFLSAQHQLVLDEDTVEELKRQ